MASSKLKSSPTAELIGAAPFPPAAPSSLSSTLKEEREHDEDCN